MNFWVAVVSIVAIVMFAHTAVQINRFRAEKKTDDGELDAALARVQELEERIRVLERIVTEDKHDLRREISQL
ncbi:MAG: hypothetical protein KJO82_00715 [Gammaproteobacteria bacterium]|nr:hypothetical protein [Gammaproteobacteria bacterium]